MRHHERANERRRSMSNFDKDVEFFLPCLHVVAFFDQKPRGAAVLHFKDELVEFFSDARNFTETQGNRFSSFFFVLEQSKPIAFKDRPVRTPAAEQTFSLFDPPLMLRVLLEHVPLECTPDFQFARFRATPHQITLIVVQKCIYTLSVLLFGAAKSEWNK